MRRTLALILALVMTMALVACGGDKPTSSAPTTPSNPTQSSKPSEPSQPSQPTEPAKPAEPKIIARAESVPATSAYPLVGNNETEYHMTALIVGRPYNYVPVDGKAVMKPQLASEEPIDVNGDGKTWSIKIDPNAKWENGEPITAETFEYSYKMALDPKLTLAYASRLAEHSVTIVGAKEYLSQIADGKTVAWEDVGIKALDAQTLQIVTVDPVNAMMVMRHFAIGMAGPVYQPLFEQCLSADGTTTTYGTEKAKVMSSGPFVLTNWVHNSIREFAKNENYLHADLIKLDGYRQPEVEDDNTKLQMFENGELDQVQITAAAAAELGDDPRVMTVPTMYYRAFAFNSANTEKPILANENFRKAIFYATDRATIAKLSGDSPATALISPMSIARDDGTTFRSIAAADGYDQLDNYGYNPTLAKQYFDTAMKEEGLTTLELTLLAHTHADHEIMAQYVQEDWQNIFGKDVFKLNIDAQASKTAQAQRRSWKTVPTAFDIAIVHSSRATAEFDPLDALFTITDKFTTPESPYTYIDEISAIYAAADTPENKTNQEVRIKAAMDIEKLIIEHAVLVPVIYNSTFQMINENVIVPLDSYHSGLNWGLEYADIKQ